MYFKPLKIFIPFSGIIFLLGLASGGAAWAQGQSLTGIDPVSAGGGPPNRRAWDF